MNENNIAELKTLAKQTLGIVESATAKDLELEMLIKASVKDMERAGVNVDTENELVQKCILTYIKANFGISNPTDKEKFLNSYQLCLAELSLSEGFREVEEDAGLDN